MHQAEVAALGLYRVLVAAVTEQRRGIGIRMALGARPGDVVSHTLRSALSMHLVGLAARLAGAFALTPRTEESLVRGVCAGPGPTRRCLRSNDCCRPTGGLDRKSTR